MNAPRNGWAETLGHSLRRDHRIACRSSADRRAHRHCGCPYSLWVPDPTKRDGRRRERINGALSTAQAKREKQRLVIQARARAAEAAESSTPRPETSIPTLYEWVLQCFHRAWPAQGLSPKTLQDREVAYRLRIHEPLGHLPIDAITAQVVEDWMYTLIEASGHRRCVEVAHATLSAVLGLAARRRVIDFNPVSVVPFPKAPPNPDAAAVERVLTRGQYDTLKASCTTLGDLALIRVATEVGLRQGELAGLQWGDITETRIDVRRALWQGAKDGRVLKMPKSGRTRRVPIHPDLHSLLWSLHAEQGAPADDAPVWPGRGTRSGPQDPSQHMSPSSVGKRATRLVERAGLVDDHGRPLVTLHGLRATCGTLMALSGIPLPAIQRVLGHASYRTTERHYVRVRRTGRLRPRLRTQGTPRSASHTDR